MYTLYEIPCRVPLRFFHQQFLSEIIFESEWLLRNLSEILPCSWGFRKKLLANCMENVILFKKFLMRNCYLFTWTSWYTGGFSAII